MLFFWTSISAYAFQINLTDASKPIVIQTSAITYVKDTTEKHHLQLSDFHQGYWKKLLEKNIPETKIFGIQNVPFWFHFSITSEKEIDRIFYLDYPLTDRIDFYHSHESKIVNRTKTGDLTPFNTRKIHDPAFAIPIKIKVGKNDFYVRIASVNSIQFTPTIYTTEQFYKNVNKNTITHGLFYGWLLVMFLYNLFLFFSTWDKNFIFMCLLTLSNGFLFLSTSGLGLQYLWQDALEWNQISFVVFAVLVSIFSVLFSASFLELRKNHPSLFIYHKVIAFLLLGLLSATFFSGYSSLIKPTMLIIFHNSFFFPITAIIVLRKGNKRAKYILIAWSVYLIGTLIALNSGTSILLPTWLKSFNILQLGAALEVLLFSIALGDTINHLKEEILLKEVEKIQLKNHLITEHNIQLEQTVKERTKDLQKANTIKDKFFAIIAHDLRSSVTAFNGIGGIINSYLSHKNFEKITALAVKIDNASEQLSIFLDNLLNWSFTQLNRVPYHPINVDLEKICVQEIAFKQELLNAKKLKTNLLNTENKHAFADKNGVALIVGNLLNNAIKFTPPEGKITLEMKSDSQWSYLIVRDSGVGMDSEQLEELFTLKRHNSLTGTEGEKGSGLGLILCREFAELNKGKISVKSKKDNGTSVTVQLPKTSDETT